MDRAAGGDATDYVSGGEAYSPAVIQATKGQHPNAAADCGDRELQPASAGLAVADGFPFRVAVRAPEGTPIRAADVPAAGPGALGAGVRESGVRGSRVPRFRLLGDLGGELVESEHEAYVLKRLVTLQAGCCVRVPDFAGRRE